MWRWVGDDPTVPAVFGDPTMATGYTLCLYDSDSGTPQLAAQFAVPPGINWARRGSGFAYRDRGGDNDGITSVRLHASMHGSARLAVSGRGSLPLPVAAPAGGMFAQDPEVTAQLVTDGGSCWEARYIGARVNRADMFVAR